MKLNKKVFAGALALAMGLGVVAPAVNSFAANNTSGQELVTNDYKKAEEAFVAVFEKNQELKDSIPAKEKAVEDAQKAYDEAVEAAAAADYVNDPSEENYKEDNSVIAEFKALKDAKEAANNDFETYIEQNQDGLANLEKDSKEYVTADEDRKASILKAYTDAGLKEYLETAVGYAQALEEAQNAVSDYQDKYKDFEDKTEEAQTALQEAKDALAYAKGYDSSAEYKEARDAFIRAGAEKAIIDKAEETGVYVPETPVEEEDLTEKIEAQLKVNKKKLSALEALKEYMPETYKLYKDRIDTAIANAEKAIKQAEDFLKNNKEKKTASLFTVAYASDATNEPTAEEVLKDLQDSEKEMDDVRNDIEKDSKEENDKNEANTDDDADADDDANTDDDADADDDANTDDDKAVVVEKKEDVKASKNVKTGVAGVAGVGAVLAAASAAYVSSKRK